MHLVPVDKGKSRSICSVDNVQLGIGEMGGVVWRIIYHEILDRPVERGPSDN